MSPQSPYVPMIEKQMAITSCTSSSLSPMTSVAHLLSTSVSSPSPTSYNPAKLSLIISSSGHITQASPNLMNLLSANKPSNILGNPVVQWVHPEDIDGFINALSNVISKQVCLDMKYRLRSPQGYIVCDGRGIPSQGGMILESDVWEFESDHHTQPQKQLKRQSAHLQNSTYVLAPSPQLHSASQPRQSPAMCMNLNNMGGTPHHQNQGFGSHRTLNAFLQSPLDLSLDPLDYDYLSDHASPTPSSSARSSVSVATNSSAASSTSSLLSAVSLNPPLSSKNNTNDSASSSESPGPNSVSVSVAALSLSPFASCMGTPQPQPTVTMEDMSDVQHWGPISPYVQQQSTFGFDLNTNMNAAAAASSPLDEYYYYCYPPTQSPSFGSSYWDNTTNNELISPNFACAASSGGGISITSPNIGLSSPLSCNSSSSSTGYGYFSQRPGTSNSRSSSSSAANSHSTTNNKHNKRNHSRSQSHSPLKHHQQRLSQNPAPYTTPKRASLSQQGSGSAGVGNNGSITALHSISGHGSAVSTGSGAPPIKARRRSKVGGVDEEQHVCDECDTRESPEWRKGPNGPKTLCNACGLRWAKWAKKNSVDYGRK